MGFSMLGPTELMLIVGIALLLFGPSRIAGVGKSLGEGIRLFKSGLQGDEPAPKKAVGAAGRKKKPKKEKEMSGS